MPPHLTPADAHRLKELLELDAPVNVYLLGVLARPVKAPDDLVTDGRFFGLPERGPLGAVVYVSHTGLVIPFAPDAALLGTLAERVWGAVGTLERPGDASPPVVRIVTGPRDAVGLVGRVLRGAHAFRLERRMRHYGLERGRLRVRPELPVERADARDTEHVCRLVAAMHAEELDRDPNLFENPAFRAKIRSLIEAGRVVVGRAGGEIAFHVSISASSGAGATIEAVYTAPAFRRRGLATGALASVCAELLTRFPRVVLTVAEDNAPAVAVYERLGFSRGAPIGLLAT